MLDGRPPYDKLWKDLDQIGQTFMLELGKAMAEKLSAVAKSLNKTDADADKLDERLKKLEANAYKGWN